VNTFRNYILFSPTVAVTSIDQGDFVRVARTEKRFMEGYEDSEAGLRSYLKRLKAEPHIVEAAVSLFHDYQTKDL